MKFVPSWLQQLGQSAQSLPTLQALPGANAPIDPRTMADVLAEMYSAQDDLSVADRLSSAEYIPNSGIGGALAMGLQAFAGKKMRDKSQGKLSDLLREKSELMSRAEREELEREQAKAQAEFERKMKAAQAAGYTPQQALAVAEGVPLPKEKDAYDRWLESQSPDRINQAFSVKAGLAPRPGSGTSVNIAAPESDVDRAIRLGWMTPEEAQLKFRRDQGLELPIKDQVAADADAAKAAGRADNAVQQADSVLQEIRGAKELVSGWTAGPGGILADVPGTPARDLRARLTSIKANLGFDRLQQMREMSPTGGALGQVAVQELEALQATVASLDQLQSQSQLMAALDKIERHYNRWQQTVMQSRPQGSQPGEIIPNSQAGGRSLEELLGQY